MELIFMVLSGLFAFVACFMAGKAHTYLDSAKWAQEKAEHASTMAKHYEQRLFGADTFNNNK